MLTNILYNNHEIRLSRDLRVRCRKAKSLNTKPEKVGINGKNFLTLIACHVNNITKVKIVINNIKKLEFSGNKIVIISSNNTPHNHQMVELVSKMYPDVEIFSIPNSMSLDIGKCMFYIKNEYTPDYDYVVFTNDSIYLNAPIYHYYKFMEEASVELYGHNDSRQEGKYHYQSFLYGIQKHSIQKLVNHFNNVESKLTGYVEVVENIEKKLVDLFEKKDCFLKIANLPNQKDKNVYFNNDTLYFYLKNAGAMSIVKLKRASGQECYNPNSHLKAKLPTTMNNTFRKYGTEIPKLL